MLYMHIVAILTKVYLYVLYLHISIRAYFAILWKLVPHPPHHLD